MKVLISEQHNAYYLPEEDQQRLNAKDKHSPNLGLNLNLECRDFQRISFSQSGGVLSLNA